MRLPNFSKISELCDYSVKNPENKNFLSELASLTKDQQLTDEWFTNNSYQIQQLIEAGFISKMDSGKVEFIDQLHFEFFLSFKFITENFKAKDSFCSFVDLLWEKVNHRSNRNQKIKLSNDFTAICLTVVNNFFEFNILKETNRITEQCFQELHFELDKALPFFDSSAEDIHQYLKFLLTKDNENSFAPGIANALNKCASLNSGLGSNLLSLLESDADTKIKTFIPALILGLANSKGNSFILPILISKIKSSNDHNVSGALFVLSRLNIETDEWKNYSPELLKALKLIENSTNDNYKCLLPAIYLQHFSLIPLADRLLVNYSLLTNVQYQIALAKDIFYYEEKLINEPCYEMIVLNSANWDYSNTGLINSVRMYLHHVIENDPGLAIKFWNAWIGNEKNELPKFSIFKYEFVSLYAKNQKLFEQWITLSFISPNIRFHKAMQLVISELWVSGFKNPSLSIDLLNTYTFFEIKYILFKILAFIHSKNSLESLVFSMLRKEPFDYDVAQLVANAFMQYICYNYGGSYSYLKKMQPTVNKDIQLVINTVIENLDIYHKHIKDIHLVNELKWQNKQGVSFIESKMKSMTKEFHEGMEKNKEGSIRSFMKNINLKGGKKFFSKYEGNYTKSTPLQNIGTTFELPAGEFIDPVKEIIKRLEWSNYKMKE